MNLFEGCSGKKLANELRWLHEPLKWDFENERLTVVPAEDTDLFSGYRREPRSNVCLLFREVSGDFTVKTRVSVSLKGFGDAAALTVLAEKDRWAKLCLERSPAGELNAVSVVNYGWSDDANGELIGTSGCYLRITRKDDLFGMHYSLDGARWRFVRAFALELPRVLKIGIHAQAPYGGGCEAVFDFLDLQSVPVANFKSGE
ncbi:MAG TPA: DUF1349 domain-containing protein [Spirochaetia bacterium]|nr:DUF1349 domain-containing protein [Spirochaetia bacterium]